jgi:hypothetical protein
MIDIWHDRSRRSLSLEEFSFLKDNQFFLFVSNTVSMVVFRFSTSWNLQNRYLGDQRIIYAVITLVPEKMVCVYQTVLLIIIQSTVFVSAFIPITSSEISHDGLVSSEVEDTNFAAEDDKCAGDDGVGLVCKDPIGQYCFQSKCICREAYVIEWEGVCLKNASLGEPCWVSQQCSSVTPHTACLRSSGRILHDIFEPLWEVFIKSEGNSKYIPGKCGCDPEYKLQVVLNSGFYGLSGPAFNTCVPRSIGSSCRTNYECASKTRFSRCQEKKCVCPSPDYEHQYSSDECISTKKETTIDCLQDIENGSCVTTEKEKGMWSRIRWSSDVAGFLGFAASMSLVVLVWYTCCQFSGSGDSDEYDYTSGSAAWLREGDFSDLGEDQEDDDTDEDPPSYEDAVIKKNDPQAATSATFRNPSAINNS